MIRPETSSPVSQAGHDLSVHRDVSRGHCGVSGFGAEELLEASKPWNRLLMSKSQSIQSSKPFSQQGTCKSSSKNNRVTGFLQPTKTKQNLYTLYLPSSACDLSTQASFEKFRALSAPLKAFKITSLCFRKTLPELPTKPFVSPSTFPPLHIQSLRTKACGNRRRPAQV